MKNLMLVIALAFFANGAGAFPIATEPRPEFLPRMSVADGYNFEGIVSLSNCSGSLVQFEGQPDTDHAYVLSNGHCYEGGFPEPGEVIYGRSSSRRFTLLGPNGNDVGRVRATHIVYATMTKTDASLYRLQETFEQIRQNYNIRPLTMSSEHPQLNQPIEVLSGYWREGFACHIEHFVYKLREGSWENEDSIRYSRSGCNTYGGTSGSPVLALGTRTVIGVNNTGNESGRRCTENNPCEIDKDGGVFYERGLSYGQQTYWFYSCLTPTFEIDLNLEGCQLPH